MSERLLYILLWLNCIFQLTVILHPFQQPNARKEDLFGRPSQGLYSSSYMATKGLAEASVDRNCLEVNMGSSLPSPSQVYHPSSLNKQAGSCVQISKHNFQNAEAASVLSRNLQIYPGLLIPASLFSADYKSPDDNRRQENSGYVDVWILEHSLCSVSHFHISILSSSHCHPLRISSLYFT